MYATAKRHPSECPDGGIANRTNANDDSVLSQLGVVDCDVVLARPRLEVEARHADVAVDLLVAEENVPEDVGGGETGGDSRADRVRGRTHTLRLVCGEVGVPALTARVDLNGRNFGGVRADRYGDVGVIGCDLD